MAHIALFRENFQKIQHIGMHLAPEAVVKDLAAFRLGQAGRGQQPDEFRCLAKAFPQGGQLPADLLREVFVPGKLVQGFAVNISHFRHTLSPNSSMKRSIISAWSASFSSRPTTLPAIAIARSEISFLASLMAFFFSRAMSSAALDFC